VKELLLHAKGYWALKSKYSTKEMRVRLYAGLLTYRRVTDGPSVNPMDYMFSTKHMLNISTAYGFKLYMALHLKPMSETIHIFSNKMTRTTYSLYQATMQNDVDKIADTIEIIIGLHKDIDTYTASIPNDIVREVNSMAYHQMEGCSLSKRMERIMENRES
jgi:hypothetical protein